MDKEKRSIVIKKVKKVAGGHHGGAWKLAYSDFVTAMMAFFLLMWLLGSTTEGDKRGIADYFNNPWKPSLLGGSGSGDATSVIKGGGEDISRSYGQVKRTNSGRQNKIGYSAEESSGHFLSKKSPKLPSGSEKSDTNDDENIDAENEEAIDKTNLNKTKQQIQDLINKNEVLHEYSSQFGIDITNEGLRIQVVDQDKRPMFSVGSIKMEQYAIEIMRQIAPVIEQLPNRISITGHTDARPYSGSGKGYSNWELSADRANAARRALINGGVSENKFFRIVGLADSVHLDQTNPLNPINRRISIIVMNHNTEHQLIKNSGPLSKIYQDDSGSTIIHLPKLPTNIKVNPSSPAIKLNNSQNKN